MPEFFKEASRDSSKNIYYISGNVGTASHIKLANNTLLASNLISVAEVMNILENEDIDFNHINNWLNNDKWGYINTKDDIIIIAYSVIFFCCIIISHSIIFFKNFYYTLKKLNHNKNPI